MQSLTRDEGERFHVWSPAHAIYKAKFVQEWQARHPGQNPILKEDTLCMTPMVIVFWKERYDAFLAKYKTVSFDDLERGDEREKRLGRHCRQTANGDAFASAWPSLRRPTAP